MRFEACQLELAHDRVLAGLRIGWQGKHLVEHDLPFRHQIAVVIGEHVLGNPEEIACRDGIQFSLDLGAQERAHRRIRQAHHRAVDARTTERALAVGPVGEQFAGDALLVVRFAMPDLQPAPTGSMVMVCP